MVADAALGALIGTAALHLLLETYQRTAKDRRKTLSKIATPTMGNGGPNSIWNNEKALDFLPSEVKENMQEDTSGTYTSPGTSS